MAPRKRREKSPEIKLKQPDRSGPTDETLLQWADERKLFEKAEQQKRAGKKTAAAAAAASHEQQDDDNDEALPPQTDRIMETMLWTTSLAMMHGTLDVVVQNQYAIEIEWPKIASRSAWSFLMFFLLFYVLHPHPSSQILLPGLPARMQRPLRQVVFFVGSVAAGCRLIYVTNSFGYLAVMKQAPTLACLWLWAVIELDLPLAAANLVVAGLYLWYGGYAIR